MDEKPTKNLSRIDNLTKKGHEYLQNGDINRSYSSYEEALHIAQEINDDFTLRACFFNIGACCVAKSEAQKGLEYLVRAVPPDKYSDGTLNFSDLYFNMAVAYDILNNPTESKRCYEIALEGYQELSKLDMVGQTCLKLGGSLAAIGSLTDAVNVFREGEKVFHQLEDNKQEVLSLSSRATILAELKDDTCLSLLTEIVQKLVSLENDELKAKVYSDIGLVYTSSAQYEVAAQYFEKSLQLLKSNGQNDRKLIASVYQNLGAVHNQLEQYVKAIIYHENAIDIYGVLSLRYAQGHSFSNLGFAYGQLGELEKAQEHFTHALQAAKDSQDYQGQWQAYEGLSAINFHKKEYDNAIHHLKTALTVLPRSGVMDSNVQERIVAKLSNALEAQLLWKQGNDIDDKVNSITKQKRKQSRKQRKINVEVHGMNEITRASSNNQESFLDESFKDTDRYPSKNNDPLESSSKIGHVRPREKNHKFIARGLHIDEHSLDNERSDPSDLTFDTISSYSGHTASVPGGDGVLVGKTHQLSNLESTATSVTLHKSNKDPLNNTYEEPQDIVNLIDTGKLRLRDLPPGPRESHDNDAILSTTTEVDYEHKISQRKKKNITAVCIIQ